MSVVAPHLVVLSLTGTTFDGSTLTSILKHAPLVEHIDLTNTHIVSLHNLYLTNIELSIIFNY
jgi:hypothetical protein